MAENHDASTVDILLLETISLYEQGSLMCFRCECNPDNDEPVHTRAQGFLGLKLVGNPVIRRDSIGTSCRDGRQVRIVEISVLVKHLIFGCSLSVTIGTARGHCEVSHRQGLAALNSWRSQSEDISNWSGYDGWVRTRCSQAEQEREREEARGFDIKPLISFITPVYRTPERYLRDLLNSISAQTYTHWEHVIVNVSGECPEVDAVLDSYEDPRIRVITATNRNISENTNVGIAAAKGDYIAFIDHDDFIEPDTLFRYVESINKNPDADLLFCNEDLYREQEGEEQRYYGARFKPGWNPDLLFGSNYVCHMLCVSRKAINETVRSGADVAGAQDYDLTFKTCERARSIVHVPYLLYHWRDHAGSTATHRETKPYALEAGRLSIQRHFERKGIKAEVSPAEYPFSYRVRYAMPDDMKASVIVVATLGDGVSGCIESIAEHTHAYAKEIIVAATQANLLPDGLDGVKKISANSRIWSMLANEGARAATGDVLVFVDEHCLVTDDGWLESTIEYLMRPEVGCAAPMAVYPDHTVCSVGGMIASDGTVTYQSHNLPEVVDGYMIFHKIAHDCSIVPPILLAVRRGDFERLGAFSKELGAPYAVADFCLKLHEEGKACVVQPFSRVTCREIYGERLVQSEAQQKELLLLRHSQMVSADPYVDPSFDRDKSYYHTYFMSDGKA